jgi:thioredoxin 1
MAGKIKEFTSDNFTKDTAKGVFLIDFFAVWCGPCRMLTPILEELAEKLTQKAFIGKIDIDKEESLAAKFQVMSVPTLILFKNGKEIDRVVGLRDIDFLKSFIEKAL